MGFVKQSGVWSPGSGVWSGLGYGDVEQGVEARHTLDNYGILARMKRDDSGLDLSP